MRTDWYIITIDGIFVAYTQNTYLLDLFVSNDWTCNCKIVKYNMSAHKMRRLLLDNYGADLTDYYKLSVFHTKNGWCDIITSQKSIDDAEYGNGAVDDSIYNLIAILYRVSKYIEYLNDGDKMFYLLKYFIMKYIRYIMIEYMSGMGYRCDKVDTLYLFSSTNFGCGAVIDKPGGFHASENNTTND